MRRYNEQMPIVSPFSKSSLYSFNRCGNLKSIKLSNRLTSIGANALNCSKLKIYYDGSAKKWASVGGGSTYTNKVTYDCKNKYVINNINSSCRELAFDFDESLFSQSGYVYNHALARASVGLEMPAFCSENDLYTGEGKSLQIHMTLEEMGFTNISSVMYDLSSSDNADREALTIATKHLSNGKELIAVAVRGSGYGAHWRSNFNISDGKDDTTHRGFGLSADQIYANLKLYIEYAGIDPKNAKIWIVGYSRAAAVGNLVAGKINSSGLIDRDNLYGYFFATPNNIKAKADTYPNSEIHNNIFNILMPMDIVPEVPLSSWNYTKYGVQLKITNNIYDSYFASKKDAKIKDSISFRKVKEYYADFTGEEYSILVDSYDNNRNLVAKVSKIFKTSDYYYDNLQGLVMDLSEVFMYYNGDFSPVLDRYRKQLSENYYDYADACADEFVMNWEI